MRNLIFTFLLLFIGFTVAASDADLFKLDYESVQKEFAGLEQVSDILADNPEMTFTSLMETNASLIESVNLSPTSALPMAPGEPFLGIPSFLWGCCFGLVGILVVYIGTEQDSGEAKKALWGCVAGSLAWTITYFLIYGFAIFAGG